MAFYFFIFLSHIYYRLTIYHNKKIYRCFNWNKDHKKTKGIYISETFQHYREKSLKNITSKEGIEERINRSIQAEGAFSKIKDGLSYNRFNHRAKANVKSEINLISIALNLNKLASKIINEQKKYFNTAFESDRRNQNKNNLRKTC